MKLHKILITQKLIKPGEDLYCIVNTLCIGLGCIPNIPRITELVLNNSISYFGSVRETSITIADPDKELNRHLRINMYRMANTKNINIFSIPLLRFAVDTYLAFFITQLIPIMCCKNNLRLVLVV